MTGLQPELGTASDAALISRVRLGDRLAFEALARRHLPAMRLVADILEPADSERLVGESLDVACHHLRRAAGPQTSLRTYLLLLTRRLATEDVLPLAAVPFRDHRGSEQHSAVGAEFARLPEGWQAAVWHLQAEREPVDEVASVLGVATAGVERLVTSARKELRAALTSTRGRALPPACTAHTLRLARAHGAVAPRSVLKHAARCARCVVLVGDLEVVERDLPLVLARHLLGPAADSYVDARRAAARVG
jgi:hypothetical protein